MLQEHINNIKALKYTAPASQYPYYLVELQKELDAVVKAVALVDQQESFWPQDIAKEILQESDNRNERVFVFMNELDFNKNASMLQGVMLLTTMCGS